MLNERRVKHMVKLAAYESKYGERDMKASSYFKKDYISFNMLCSMLWVTLAYVILVGLLGLAYMEPILENLTIESAIAYVAGVVVVYVILLVFYGIISARFYKKKHTSARRNLKKFKHDLEILEKIYQREEA